MRARMTVAVVVAAATGLVAVAPAASAKGCGGHVYAGPAGGEGEADGGTSIWGAKSTKVQYKWTVQGDIGKVNVSVMGYDENMNPYWQYTGLWNSGTHGSTTVNWGAVASVPRIRVKTPPGPFPGVMVDWSC